MFSKIKILIFEAENPLDQTRLSWEFQRAILCQANTHIPELIDLATSRWKSFLKFVQKLCHIQSELITFANKPHQVIQLFI